MEPESPTRAFDINVPRVLEHTETHPNQMALAQELTRVLLKTLHCEVFSGTLAVRFWMQNPGSGILVVAANSWLWNACWWIFAMRSFCESVLRKRRKPSWQTIAMNSVRFCFALISPPRSHLKETRWRSTVQAMLQRLLELRLRPRTSSTEWRNHPRDTFALTTHPSR